MNDEDIIRIVEEIMKYPLDDLLKIFLNVLDRMPGDLPFLLVEAILHYPMDIQVRLIVELEKHHAGDKQFLEWIAIQAEEARATDGYKHKNYERIDRRLELAFLLQKDLTPTAAALLFMHENKAEDRNMGFYVSEAAKVKNRIVNRDRQRTLRHVEKYGHPFNSQLTDEESTERETGGDEQTMSSFYSKDDFCNLLNQFKADIDSAVYGKLVEAIELLDEEGHCPAIVSNRRDDREAEYVRNETEFILTLKRITAFDHTFVFTRACIQLVQESNLIDNGLIGAVLTGSIFHDLGRLKAVIKKLIIKPADHAKASSEYFKLQFRLINPPWYDGIATAIERHHLSHDDQMWCKLLYDAESLARNYEIRGSSDMRLVPMENWFRPEDLLAEIRPVINRKPSGRTPVFSHQNVVYVHPDEILFALRRIGGRKRCFDIRLFREPDKESVLIWVADALRDHSCLHGELKQGRYARYFRVEYSIGRLSPSKWHLLPLKAELFSSISELEQTRKGKFKLVENVIAIGS